MSQVKKIENDLKTANQQLVHQDKEIKQIKKSLNKNQSPPDDLATVYGKKNSKVVLDECLECVDPYHNCMLSAVGATKIDPQNFPQPPDTNSQSYCYEAPHISTITPDSEGFIELSAGNQQPFVTKGLASPDFVPIDVAKPGYVYTSETFDSSDAAAPSIYSVPSDRSSVHSSHVGPTDDAAHLPIMAAFSDPREFGNTKLSAGSNIANSTVARVICRPIVLQFNGLKYAMYDVFNMQGSAGDVSYLFHASFSDRLPQNLDFINVYESGDLFSEPTILATFTRGSAAGTDTYIQGSGATNFRYIGFVYSSTSSVTDTMSMLSWDASLSPAIPPVPTTDNDVEDLIRQHYTSGISDEDLSRLLITRNEKFYKRVSKIVKTRKHTISRSKLLSKCQVNSNVVVSGVFASALSTAVSNWVIVYYPVIDFQHGSIAGGKVVISQLDAVRGWNGNYSSIRAKRGQIPSHYNRTSLYALKADSDEEMIYESAKATIPLTDIQIKLPTKGTITLDDNVTIMSIVTGNNGNVVTEAITINSLFSYNLVYVTNTLVLNPVRSVNYTRAGYNIEQIQDKMISASMAPPPITDQKVGTKMENNFKSKLSTVASRIPGMLKTAWDFADRHSELIEGAITAGLTLLA